MATEVYDAGSVSQADPLGGAAPSIVVTPDEDVAVTLPETHVPSMMEEPRTADHEEAHVQSRSTQEMSEGRAKAMRDELDVHEMLAKAERRQKTFRDLRDAGDDARGIALRDDRKCDYAIAPVRRESSARQSRSARRSRGSLAVSEQSSSDQEVHALDGAVSTGAVSGASSPIAKGPIAWRNHVNVHVANLLRQLRLSPHELQVFLAIQYESREDGESSDDEENEDAESLYDGDCRMIQDAGVKRSSLSDISPQQMKRHISKFLSVKEVYLKLHQVGVYLGETLYQQVRSVLLKSVATGIIDRESNLVRLESIFKLELRRQVTLGRIRQVVMTKQAVLRKQRRQSQLRTVSLGRKHSAGKLGELEDESADGGSVQEDTFADDTDDQTDEIQPGSTTHYFKMQALERVLARQRKFGRPKSGISSSRYNPNQPVVSEQIEDQIQEKTTAIVYSKNRENYPFWKEPPECSFTREETCRQLRTVVTAFSTTAVFRGLTVDNLIDLARATRWRAAIQGEAVCVKNESMDELIVVMHGELAPDIGDGGTTPQGGASEAIPFLDERGQARFGTNTLEYFGELGMLTKTEVWQNTQRVVSTTAKLLFLTRDAFDSVIARLFGSTKRQSLASKEFLGPKRPNSSPANPRNRSRSTLGSCRPVTAASVARDRKLTSFRRYRDEQLTDLCAAAASVADTQHDCASNEPDQNVFESSRETRPRKNEGKSAVYQHYPTFPMTNDKSGSHMFRLKCTQPIAFGMESIEDSITNEWAPAFPDTSSLVDYFSSADKSFLFEKRNVLFKEHLRVVCTNLPFQDDPLQSGTRTKLDDQMSSEGTESMTNDNSSARTEAQNAATSSGTSSNHGQLGLANGIGDGEAMSLGQFAEARRKVFGRGAGSWGGPSSPSMRNIMGSASTTATLVKNGNAPFIGSSYVPETSFIDEPRAKLLTRDVEQDPHVEESTRRKSRAASILSMRSIRPEEDDDESSSAGSADNDLGEFKPSTGARARKMALDSLMHTMASTTPSKKKVLDQEAARRVILQKHLNGGGLGSNISRQETSSSAGVDPKGISTVSHAPLPLRIDLQRRMEVVLAALKMKPKSKLDLVLKYTHADFYDRFPDAVVLWEQALHYIQKREKALETLRKFELIASDPRRHFRSLSTHRLTEQKERDAFFYQLNYASDLCRESLDELEKRCEDQVYYEHRLYRDKMKKDYTELLFDVEQDRLKIIYKGTQPALPRQMDVPCREKGADDDNSRPSAGAIAGNKTSIGASRYQLSTPRESIYVSVLQRAEQDEREEQERATALAAESAKISRGGHQLSAQVKQYRQAQLDAMSKGAQKSMSHNPDTRRDQNQTEHRDKPILQSEDEIRGATKTTPVGSTDKLRDLGSLRVALQHVLGRR